MRAIRSGALAAALLACAAGAARAQAPAAPPPPVPDWVAKVTLSGVAWMHWRYEASSGAGGFNVFDITRLYLTAMARPLPHVRVRLTVDASTREATVTTRAHGDSTTVKAGGGKFDAVVKFAYGELYDVLTPGLAVRAGMVDLPWIPIQERLWTYGVQGTGFSQREGYLTAADLGAALLYTTRNRMFEGHLALVNGEGWTASEVDRAKDLHARITLRPLVGHGALSGLSLSAFGSTGASDTLPQRARRRLIAQVAYEHRYAYAAAEFLRATDAPATLVAKHPSLAASTDPEVIGQGWSAFGWVDLGLVAGPKGVRVMGRVEHLDPDTHLAHNGHNRAIAGVGFWVSDLVQVLLDGEFVNYDANAGVAQNERRFFVHASVGF